MPTFIKTVEGTGVMAILIGIDTVEGVAGTGIGIAFGVLFSSSITVAVLEGVVNGALLSGIVFCNFSLCIFGSLATYGFDDTFEDMGEKGCLDRGESSMP